MLSDERANSVRTLFILIRKLFYYKTIKRLIIKLVIKSLLSLRILIIIKHLDSFLLIQSEDFWSDWFEMHVLVCIGYKYIKYLFIRYAWLLHLLINIRLMRMFETQRCTPRSYGSLRVSLIRVCTVCICRRCIPAQSALSGVLLIRVHIVLHGL